MLQHRSTTIQFCSLCQPAVCLSTLHGLRINGLTYGKLQASVNRPSPLAIGYLLRTLVELTIPGLFKFLLCSVWLLTSDSSSAALAVHRVAEVLQLAIRILHSVRQASRQFASQLASLATIQVSCVCPIAAAQNDVSIAAFHGLASKRASKENHHKLGPTDLLKTS